MKPIRVINSLTEEEGTWVDTSDGYLVVVLDNGKIKLYLEDTVRVKSPNEVKLRTMG